MSHFARLVAQLEAWTAATGEKVTLGADIEIKCVQVVDGGYRFEARVSLPFPTNGIAVIGVMKAQQGTTSAWLLLETHEDLPAFTDKGRAHRARQIHATLKPGRPLTGEEHVVKPIAVRVSRTQRYWVERRSGRRDQTVSEYIRGLLEADGMPS